MKLLLNSERWTSKKHIFIHCSNYYRGREETYSGEGMRQFTEATKTSSSKSYTLSCTSRTTPNQFH
uniref:Uncharacterized protein n=1 Tax=Oryza brachyantha TaxID=4533 RepID=J3KZC0_ORYBR